MTDPITERLWIVGPGRIGLAIGTALAAGGGVGLLTFCGRADSPPAVPLFTSGRAAYVTRWPGSSDAPTLVLIAVPDAYVVEVANGLARSGIAPAPVLHTSGVLSSAVLSELASAGHPTGSIHPLVAVSSADEGAARLVGAWYGVEGVPDAVDAAERLVEKVKGRVLRVDPSEKQSYHAAAVFASNYVVTLLGFAERLMVSAGVDAATARESLTELARGAIGNVARSDPVRALTGPVSRGDYGTVELHLRGLSPDHRTLYSVLAREALVLAKERGLDAEAALRITRTLDSEAD